MLYTLMHRNIKVMDIEMDEFSNITSLGSIYHSVHLPTGTYNKIGVDRKALHYLVDKKINSSKPSRLKRCFGVIRD